ncbi:MAG: hypothetical protein KDK64_05895 [Chlamydiia bacterium]|nr:hypothetical protein [Chlamydiia bacterium]
MSDPVYGNSGNRYLSQQQLYSTRPYRAQSFPPHHLPHPSQLSHDLLKGAEFVRNAIFPSSYQRSPYCLQVYLFTMENYFLIMLSPGALPFAPFTHTADGLYQVNPIYQSPYFSYPVGEDIFDAVQREASGVQGVPPVMILKGTWHRIPLSMNQWNGMPSELIRGIHHFAQCDHFTLERVSNSWVREEDELEGAAYSLGDKVFRIWFHEKNPNALKNALGAKREEIKQLRKLLDFLTNIPLYHAQLKDALFTTQQEIDKIGDWRNVTTCLIEGHPDKERPEKERFSVAAQGLIKEFREKVKEITKCKKKPAEKQIKEGELEAIRVNLVVALRAFFNESMDWIERSPLSSSLTFRHGIMTAISCAEVEEKNLQEAQALLNTPGMGQQLEALRCPTSAYRSTMQIETSTENATPEQRAWVHMKYSIDLTHEYLNLFERMQPMDAPTTPVEFFERALSFLQKKMAWVSRRGITSTFDPQRLLRKVRYSAQKLQDLHRYFQELRFIFTNGPIFQKDSGDYPYLFEEAHLLNEFVGQLEEVFNAVSPEVTFQFYQETTRLKNLRQMLLSGGTIYKRVNAGGNVEYEFLGQRQRSQLNQMDRVHAPIWG